MAVNSKTKKINFTMVYSYNNSKYRKYIKYINYIRSYLTQQLTVVQEFVPKNPVFLTKRIRLHE